MGRECAMNSADQRTFDAVIVGGGHNGLVAAFYLARAGKRVCVLERRSQVGGACVTEELFPGYRVSSYSYVVWLLQPKIIADMALRRRGFRCYQLDPWRLNPYRDGSYVAYWRDETRTQGEIARLNRADAEAYPRFNAYWARASGLFMPYFLQDPPSLDAVREHADRLGEGALLDQLLTRSVADVCSEFFVDTRIKAALVKMSEVGDPLRPGGAFTESYFHSDTGLGYAVVEGGNGTVTQAMAEACREQGVVIRTAAEVERIMVEDGRVQGVLLANGDEIRAGNVLSNADPKRTYLRLLDPSSLPAGFLERVRALSTRTSYLKFHCIMDCLPDLSGYLGRPAESNETGYIHIAPSLEHFGRAHADAMSGEPAREPIVHLQIPTVYDRALTERDGHIVSMWTLYAPPHLAHGSWDSRRQEVGEHLIDHVTEFIPNFRHDIRDWRLFTPQDMERDVGLTDGNIRHLDTVPEQFLDRRPLHNAGYATPIKGLYLCGAGTHPGGEVSGAPGHNAAHAVLCAQAGEASA